MRTYAHFYYNNEPVATDIQGPLKYLTMDFIQNYLHQQITKLPHICGVDASTFAHFMSTSFPAEIDTEGEAGFAEGSSIEYESWRFLPNIHPEEEVQAYNEERLIFGKSIQPNDMLKIIIDQ